MSPDAIDLGAPLETLTDVRVRPEGDDLNTVVHDLRVAAHAQGRADGLREASETSARLLDEAVERTSEEQVVLVDRLAKTSVELACRIVRELLRAEIPSGNYDLEGIVRETLRTAARERGSYVVHVHPEDALRLEGASFRSGTEIRADSGVARADVHVETPLGLMVREIDQAFETIRDRIREELE